MLLTTRVKVFSTLGVALVLLAACNVYQPFSSKSSTEDILETAQKCLHNGDYDCAIAEYNGLPAGDLKNEQLCKVYLAKAGLGLDELLNTATQANQQMLGALANALVPWTSARGDAAATARTHCSALATSCNNCTAGVLLRVLGMLTDCATRLAKTDQVIVTGGAANNCTTFAATGNQNGRVTKSDVDNTTTFMCVDDVAACNADMLAITPSDLNNKGLTKLGTSTNLIPANLYVAGSSPYTNQRAALQDACPTN